MTCAQAKSYLAEFLPLIKEISDDRKIVIAPPFTAISTFSDHSDFDYLDISSQNIHWESEGAFTAEISPKMLLEHGVSYAIVGHSEPRKYFSESDEQINKRAVFVYLRELSGLNAKQLSVAMSNIRKHYKDLVKNNENYHLSLGLF